MVLNFVISGILAVPNVYYGVTRGNWFLGWDYVLTGHDYFGDAMDYVFGADEVTEGDSDTGLTVGDVDVLTEQFNAIYDMAIVAIVIVVVIALLVFLTGKINKKNNKRRS